MYVSRGCGRTLFNEKKNAGVSGGQPNLHIMAIAVPPGIAYLWSDANVLTSPVLLILTTAVVVFQV